MKTGILLLITLITVGLLAAPDRSHAQDTTNAPTFSEALHAFQGAIEAGNTNWYFEVHALYAPKLVQSGRLDQWGGGLGAFYPLSDFVVAGTRLDYIGGEFWMPSGNATLQAPLQLKPWLRVTPLAYVGIGIPVSGAQQNDGQPTAILGYGGAVRIYTHSKFFIDAIGDRETWTGFAGKQYRIGILFKLNF